MTLRPAPLFALVVAPIAACSAPETAGVEDPPELVQRIDLRAELGHANVTPIGVARDGERTFAFDLDHGIHELGRGPLVASMPDPGVEVRLPFTDLAHLGGDRFAVTAIGDGFVLDAAAQTMALHFCYEPGFTPLSDEEQRTDAVTVDQDAGLIYAQPQTYLLDDGSRTASSIGIYDAPTGTLLEWRELDPTFTAGGLALGRGGLLLGSGDRLYHYDLVGTAGLTELDDLGRYGIRNISGLASSATSLLVVDADTDELVELDRALLGF